MRWRVRVAILLALPLAGCATQQRLARLSTEAAAVEPMDPGQTVNVPILLRNSGDKAVLVRDVDIANTLLSGVELVGMEPVPAAEPIALRYYTVYRVDLEVPAGGTATVVLSVRGKTAGQYTGDVDLCAGNYHCRTVTLKLEVTGPVASPAAPPAADATAVPAPGPAAPVPAPGVPDAGPVAPAPATSAAPDADSGPAPAPGQPSGPPVSPPPVAPTG